MVEFISIRYFPGMGLCFNFIGNVISVINIRYSVSDFLDLEAIELIWHCYYTLNEQWERSNTKVTNCKLVEIPLS